MAVRRSAPRRVRGPWGRRLGAGLCSLWALCLPTGCPDTTIPELDVGGVRVCSVDEMLAFRAASTQTLREDLWIAFVDVGHGDATWIRTPGQLDVDAQEILVDLGDCRAADGDCASPAGQIPDDGGPDGVGALFDFMAESEWPAGNPIHQLVITHPDKDHYGGLFRFLKGYSVQTLLDPGSENTQTTWQHAEALMASTPGLTRLSPVEQTGLEAQVPGRLSTGSWGRELTVTLLSADARAQHDNDASVILMLTYRGVRILLMGDAEESLDARLVEAHGAQLRADVLRTGHHGGRTTSSEGLLKQVFPKTSAGRRYAIISAGAREGLPHPDTLKRLGAAIGVAGIYRTDRLDEGKKRREAPGDDHVILRVSAQGELTVCYAYPDPQVGL